MKKILTPSIDTFNSDNYHQLCDSLGKKDKDLQSVIDRYGYPPMWMRPNSFESLVHIILEQQVSLASALAALKKLQEKTIELTPLTVLKLSDEEMRACYVSRQKMVYIRGLANALESKTIDLKKLENLSNDLVRAKLIQLKGIGNWTIDVYLMFVLQRVDIFPIGDLAVINAIKKLKLLPKSTDKETIQGMSDNWQPYRTVASMILWHFYLSSSGSKMLPL
ncbi:DNA-3-methyladenine glycosylase family protein [Rhizosphaericola mali]|uniref:DNA-3-methyladenine glycosylase II n=1 Tax=Rhizosphaericola mali TaxID=2545455 RepID=A0A5P2G595_9BACT|nr:DNA-3-methyladenine glycosylase [Rhizosphaericola mali]QES90695.1 DNA-3-methyladenine glycosylase 2 family protein [Rhizosphaericola mali]